jgi:hypothetical protein
VDTLADVAPDALKVAFVELVVGVGTLVAACAEATGTAALGSRRLNRVARVAAQDNARVRRLVRLNSKLTVERFCCETVACLVTILQIP